MCCWFFEKRCWIALLRLGYEDRCSFNRDILCVLFFYADVVNYSFYSLFSQHLSLRTRLRTIFNILQVESVVPRF